MMKLHRHWRSVALGSALALFWPALLAAQDNVTVGNPQLRDFQLPGQRTTAPAQPQPVAPTLPATRPPAAGATAAARPARTATPALRPSRTETAPPERTPPRAVAKAPVRTAARTPEQPKPARATPAPVAATPAPAPVAQPPVAAPQPAPVPAAETPAPSAFSWPWLALPALLVLAGLAFFLRRRASGERTEQEVTSADEPMRAESSPELLLDHVAPPPETPAEAPRPWLELDIEPAQAAATASEASLQCDLVITNVGGETARNIRIDARMFNAADEPQIAAFLGAAVHRHSGSPHVTVPPGESLRIAAAVQMKAEEVQVIELQGRRIFVPSVAVNLAYDWGGSGEGRTSKSWLVGRKADKPSDRMGAFRVDLGPRIYRSVGRKDTKRVMV